MHKGKNLICIKKLYKHIYPAENTLQWVLAFQITKLLPTNFRIFTIISKAIILNEIAATIATATTASTESTSVTLIIAFEVGLKQRERAHS